MNNTRSLSDWIEHVFDHPVSDPAWHWAFDDSAWDDAPEQNATFIADAFERSGELLSRFTDEQLNQGFSYLTSPSCSNFMFVLSEPSVPLASRLRVIHSFVPLFEQVMAVRCSPHLSHLDEQPANPLNGACYIWWDILPIHGKPEDPERTEFDAEVLRVLARLLSIPHDACRESALHSINHWHHYYPSADASVDDWLLRTPGLRPNLVSYAQCAKVGMVQ